MDGGSKAGTILRDRHCGDWQPMLPVSSAVGWDAHGLALWAKLGFLTAWRLVPRDSVLREQDRCSWHF